MINFNSNYRAFMNSRTNFHPHVQKKKQKIENIKYLFISRKRLECFENYTAFKECKHKKYGKDKN